MTTAPPSPSSAAFSPVCYDEESEGDSGDFRASTSVQDASCIPDVDTIDNSTPHSAISPMARRILLDTDYDDDIENDFPVRKLPLGVPDDTDEDEEISSSDHGRSASRRESQHSLPDVEDLKLSVAAAAGGGRRRLSSLVSRSNRKRIIYPVLLLILAVVVVVFFIMSAVDDTTNQIATNQKVTQPSIPDDDGIIAASDGLIVEDRLRYLQDYMVQHGVSTLEQFRDEASSTINTPQSQAARWMAYEDNQFPTFPTPDKDPKTSEGYSLVSRYAMAVLYFATNGKNWENSLNFMDPDKHTCDWFTVFPPPKGEVGVLCNQTTRRIIGLSLISNKLVGTIPSELSQVTSLEYIESIENELAGPIPLEWQELTNLRTLVMAFNELTGTLPPWMPQSWPDMEFMYLSNNLLSGTIPPQFFAFEKLSVLALDDNILTGHTDVVWDNMKALEYIYLEDNDFTGNLPRNISEAIPNVIALDISSNRFMGFLPQDLFHLKNLQILDLHDNRFQLAIPGDIPEDNYSLKFIALHKNLLNGQIPSTLGNLKALSHLDVTRNYLTGTIPNELGLLSNSMTYLFLGWNDYNWGPIPSFVYAMTNLRELSLKSSKRLGTISGVIGALEHLLVLDLNDNALTGSIPNEIGMLTNLQFLLLQRNQLSLEVPGNELAKLSSLRFLLLDNNHIFGDLNPICTLNFLTSVYVDCGEVACLEGCCSCCNDGSACHDNLLIRSHDPVWESDYKRSFFNMNEEEFNSNRDDDYWK